MDLDVADASISSLLRRAGTTASPASGPPSEDRRQRRPDRRRDTLVVRNALLRRAAAGRRRSPAKNDMEQFVRDQELAFDASTSSVDLNMSGSPTTRARSFLAHQRRSLSGDELAALLRDLRSGERRVSVGVPQRQLAALGDDGMQALLGLVDDGLEEFEGTMTASMEEEEETPTPTPSPGPAADEPDRQPSVGDEGSTAGETAADRAEEEVYDEGAGVEVGSDDEQAAGTAGGRDAELPTGMEIDGEDEPPPATEDIESDATVVREPTSSSINKSRRRRSSGHVEASSASVNRSLALTPRAPIHRTPSPGAAGEQSGAGGGTTPSSRRRSRLSRFRFFAGSPTRDTGESLHETPSTVQPPTATTGSAASTPAKRTPAKSTPASNTPLRSATPRRTSLSRSPGSVPRSGGPASSVDRPDRSPSIVLRRRSRLSGTFRTQAASSAESPAEDTQAAGDKAQSNDEHSDEQSPALATPVAPLRKPAVSSSSSGRRRSAPVTQATKVTPSGGSARKKAVSAFERFFTGDRQRQTSTPMSEPPRRTVGSARFSAHSRSLFVAAKSPRRLSLAADEEEKQPEKRPFTSGLIDDPDEHSDASGEFQVEPAAAAGGEFPLEPAAAAGGEFQLDPAAAAGGSPQLRSPGSGRISRMSVGSRAAGTPFVPSAESTRLSMRPTGALASSGPSAREASAGETSSAAEAPSRSPAADRSAAPAGSPARSRSLRTSLAGGTTPIQAQPAAAAAGSSSSRPKTKPDPRRPAPGSKLSAKEAFARLFPSFESDQKSRREEAAAKRRHRSSSGPQRKRNSLFGSHGTRRWFKRNAVGLRVTHEALNEVDVAMAKYERMVMRWLREVTGPDRAPTTSDILAVLRRSGTATTEPRLRQLIRMHMPLEQQQELIRVSEYGGRLYPTDNPLEEE
ncbi:mucin-12-like [Amphibalanus amphitrite]|uniref:mucin-12-like n=1 Tax=Amphibalanus amphitrite TaxID=1232801 RepID=UPI001C926857|nr:mucin-12-like [Amphibalanus amphitrite]XP_043192467.1 mucin-12-like [Amphibalanus amphitrite]XP_043192468.1 mucin-12-like [Amphibalanus amphitrite]